MRKYLASMVFTGCALAASSVMATPSVNEAESTVAPAVAVQHVRLPMAGLRDEAAMVLVGTALIGLAAAVRRAA